MLNINVGIIGHIDSGKTSLAKALSNEGSTASFDKNPQSQERGITIDLGFSVVRVPGGLPERFRELPFDEMTFTLVDCPGHASFIRTIIGGAQIIDFMLLVIDATKGVQTQTAEGLVIAELTAERLVVAMNKVDMFPDGAGESSEEYVKSAKKVSTILSKTKFANAPLIPISANPRSGAAKNLDKLMETLIAVAPVPKREHLEKESFLFYVDHCFSLKGQGVIMTGTVLRGSVAVNDMIEVADMKVTKKVKSIQRFRKPVDKASSGDRVGIAVAQFEADALERGLVCFPNSVSTAAGGLFSCSRIRYFPGDIATGMRFHISIGHRTTTAKVFFLRRSGAAADEFEWEPDLPKKPVEGREGEVVALLQFDADNVLVPKDSLYIASKLDADVESATCRLAFSGNFLHPMSFENVGSGFVGTTLRVFKRKEKIGSFDRITSDTEVICKGLFKSNFDMNLLQGLQVVREFDGAIGEISGNFGSAKNAKFKVRFGGGGLEKMDEGASKKIIFRYKKYLGIKDDKKKWIQ